MSDNYFDQVWAIGSNRLPGGMLQGHSLADMAVNQTEGRGRMFEADFLRCSPAGLEFRQRGLRQQVENTAAAIVDDDDDRVLPTRQGQAAREAYGRMVSEMNKSEAQSRARLTKPIVV